jgi:hypothetical protein
MFNNDLLHGGCDKYYLKVRRMMTMMPTLMLMHAMRTVFGVIIIVWEVIIIMVIMILLLKQNLP